jgi:hypothetical protein
MRIRDGSIASSTNSVRGLHDSATRIRPHRDRSPALAEIRKKVKNSARDLALRAVIIIEGEKKRIGRLPQLRTRLRVRPTLDRDCGELQSFACLDAPPSLAQGEDRSMRRLLAALCGKLGFVRPSAKRAFQNGGFVCENCGRMDVADSMRWNDQAEWIMLGSGSTQSWTEFSSNLPSKASKPPVWCYCI